jgi:mono/diheme cytochrome c family protein
MRRVLIVALLLVSAATLLGLVAGCGGDDETTTTAAATETTAAGGGGADGAEVFASICAGCHGADGTGGTGPDLTASTSLTKDGIVDQVTNGGTNMPAYGDQLSTEEIDAVADYVLSDIAQQ